MKLYLSGPMSGLPNHNVPAFNAAAKKLRAKGYRVVNPAELDDGEPCKTWEDCLRRDLRVLTRCSAIATLPGWTKSRGALLEIHVAKALAFEVHTVGYYLRKGRRNAVHQAYAEGSFGSRSIDYGTGGIELLNITDFEAVLDE